MKTISGGCLCGAICYQTDADVLMAYRCHCTDCQKSSGAGHLAVFAVPTEQLTLVGKLKYYDKKGDSGNGVSLGFCADCGSNIAGKPDSAAGVTALTAGSLDDSNQYEPTMDIFTDSAPSWDSLAEGTVKLPGMFT